MINQELLSQTQKFDAYKNHLISENEKEFGKEIREKYGNESVNRAHLTISSMTQTEYEKQTDRETHILFLLSQIGDGTAQNFKNIIDNFYRN